MNVVNNSDVIYSSGIVFGTSGARGLVKDFTPQVCAAFYIICCRYAEHFSFDTVALAIDNRPSSYGYSGVPLHWRIKALTVAFYGVAPTPALAQFMCLTICPAIMVTCGSHIIHSSGTASFYRPDGEHENMMRLRS
ncbi:hypothetical protein KCP74_15075 [Salmonella enterica subsp. enterica]|nr:hypothetical protein KCP74_15075 [Salmonella enterica subsp. enterica]